MEDGLVPTRQQDNGSVPQHAPVPACPLADLPEPLHQYIHGLEQRIVILEAEQKRFIEALRNAGAMLFSNSGPMKMFAAAFPKEMKAKLQEFFKGVGS